MGIDLKKFYEEKKVLVTGNTGFKGTWMTLFLEIMGAKVYGYSLPHANKYVSDEFYQRTDPKSERIVYGDIANKGMVLNAVQQFQPDIIFHLASHSSLNKNCDIPHHILETNIMGVVNIMEAVRLTESVKAVVIVTSDKVYEIREIMDCYDEKSILGGNEPYSTSKVCQELITECYFQTFFCNNGVGENSHPVCVATARASNVIGPGDYNFSRLFPYLINTFANEQIPVIRNPRAIRSWQSVLDVVMGYLILGRHLYEMSDSFISDELLAYNFGPGADGFETVENVARIVSNAFGKKEFMVQEKNGYSTKETKVLKLDSSKANRELHWKPIIMLEDCILQTVQFAKSELLGENVGKLARDLVEEYLVAWEKTTS